MIQSDLQIQALLRELGESSVLFGGRPAVSLMRMRRASLPIAAAAAIVLAAVSFRPASLSRAPADRAAAAGTDMPVWVHEEARYSIDGRRVGHVRACSDEEGYALVLIRTWSDDLREMVWKLHRFDDGSDLARMCAGCMLEIPVDVSSEAPRPQALVLALARHRQALPAGPAERENLLSCLNETLPPAWGDEGYVQSSAAAFSCLPSEVTLVRQGLDLR